MLLTIGRRLSRVLFAGIVTGFGAAVWAASSSIAAVPTQSAAPPLVISSVRTPRPVVALTFDDGPEPGSTNVILAILRHYGAHATFFVVGRQAERYPRYVQQIALAGDEVENHGMNHRLLPRLGQKQILTEIRTSSDLITELTGHAPTYFRPPYGSYNARVAIAAGSLHETLVLWTIDTRDWTLRSPNAIAQSVLQQIRPGAIVLMHDGGGPRRRTAQALSIILRGLRQKGYVAVTLSELLHDAASVQSPSASAP